MQVPYQLPPFRGTDVWPHETSPVPVVRMVVYKREPTDETIDAYALAEAVLGRTKGQINSFYQSQRQNGWLSALEVIRTELWIGDDVQVTYNYLHGQEYIEVNIWVSAGGSESTDLCLLVLYDDNRVAAVTMKSLESLLTGAPALKKLYEGSVKRSTWNVIREPARRDNNFLSYQSHLFNPNTPQYPPMWQVHPSADASYYYSALGVITDDKGTYLKPTTTYQISRTDPKDGIIGSANTQTLVFWENPSFNVASGNADLVYGPHENFEWNKQDQKFDVTDIGCQYMPMWIGNDGSRYYLHNTERFERTNMSNCSMCDTIGGDRSQNNPSATTNPNYFGNNGDYWIFLQNSDLGAWIDGLDTIGDIPFVAWAIAFKSTNGGNPFREGFGGPDSDAPVSGSVDWPYIQLRQDKDKKVDILETVHAAYTSNWDETIDDEPFRWEYLDFIYDEHGRTGHSTPVEGVQSVIIKPEWPYLGPKRDDRFMGYSQFSPNPDTGHYIDDRLPFIQTPYNVHEEDLAQGADVQTSQIPYDPHWSIMVWYCVRLWIQASNGEHIIQGYIKVDAGAIDPTAPNYHDLPMVNYLYYDRKDLLTPLAELLNVDKDRIQHVVMDIPLSWIKALT